MGSEQTWYSLFLLPVTAIFGLFSQWNRNLETVSKVQIVKWVIIILIPIALYWLISDPRMNSIFYLYDQFGRRPPMLILIPIGVSLFILKYQITKSVIVLTVIFTIGYIFTKSFILHYLVIFLLYYLLQKLTYYRTYLEGNIFLNAVFCSVSFAIAIFSEDVYRFGLVHELIWSVSSLNLILQLGEGVSARLKYCKNWWPLSNFSLLYAYIIQAVLFNIYKEYVLFDWLVGTIVTIFVSSVIIASSMNRLEKYILRRL